MITPATSQYMIDTQPTSSETEIYNQIKRTGSQKEQLKKVSAEFESIFVTKMLTLMDKTVDKEGGMFGDEGKFLKTFKSYMFNEMGRQIAHNPKTSMGFAAQIYKQMEKSVQG